MKKKIIYTLIIIASFILSTDMVLAKDMTFENDSSNYFTSDYSSCTLDANQENYIGIANINGGIMFYVKNKPEKYVFSWLYKNRANITGTCIKKSDGKKESMKFIVKENAGIYDGSSLIDGNNSSNNNSSNSNSNNSSNNNSSNTGIPMEVEIKDGESNVFIPNYSSCEFVNTTSSPAVSFEEIQNGVGIYVTNIANPEKIYSYQTERIACINNATKSKDEITVKIYGSAKVMEDSSVVGDDTTGNSDSNDSSYNVPADCDSILGDINEDGSTSKNGYPSVAYVLQKILNFMKFIGPLLVICMTIIELVKTVTSGEKDALNKMLKLTSKRIIYAVLLFVFPVILNYVLKFVSVHGTCNIT